MSARNGMTEEQKRLNDDREKKVYWKRWGPYLSERQWGTVREDYSPDGEAWNFFPFDHARSRAYRWGEDGIGGISDNHQRLCFAVALWNEKDPILKERLFGLNGTQGNHGEDVKEYYFYLDNTPTHSYMKYLYKYPHGEFPYQKLISENQKRGLKDSEYELIDTGIFNENRYFDVVLEYAKAAANDISIQVTIHNRGPEEASIHLLPTLWFRNSWSWGGAAAKPQISLGRLPNRDSYLEANHATLGKMVLIYEGKPAPLFTENETNYQKLFGASNAGPYVKDGINDYVVEGRKEAVNSESKGTKAALHYILRIKPAARAVIQLRLANSLPESNSLNEIQNIFSTRRKEADEFYEDLAPKSLGPDQRNVQRQAFAGMLWNKQFYHYVIEDWLKGDPAGPAPPRERKKGRNSEWTHLYSEDILSMPDKWEYPWFASWDTAFHCIPLALVDPDFAKKQLMLLTREWYMHPNGQIPAYEWGFGDANPPVHAWAAYRIYKIEEKMKGKGDRLFLERVFQKLLLNFTWWVNRKDSEGKNIFQGGFLGLDNISIFNRSETAPQGGHLDQSDATSWMGMYCLNLLSISLELALKNPAYEDIASKFFEHFLYIANAMNHVGRDGISLWNDEDGFYYDVLHLTDGSSFPLKVRSVVGLIPLFAVATLEPAMLKALPGFRKRVEWFLKNRRDLCDNVACMETPGVGERRLLSVVSRQRLIQILEKMLDEKEFLAPFGIRSVSRFHQDHPYIFRMEGKESRVDYEPAESSTRLFGGNSNWRGPIWLPMNYLIIEALQKYHYYLGDDFKVECPKGSGERMTLWEVATEISHRLMRLVAKNKEGLRPCCGVNQQLQLDPYWKDYLVFNEYFHGDNGTGLGASHQTGWTGLVAKLIQQCGEYCGEHKPPVFLNGSGKKTETILEKNDERLKARL